MKDDLQKSDSCGLKSERKKILTSSTCSLACLSTNLGAFCPMVVHLPSEKSILPYFSGPRGVAISVPFPEVRNRKGAESGLEKTQKMSENGEIYTAGKHFTLPPAVTNSNSGSCLWISQSSCWKFSVVKTWSDHVSVKIKKINSFRLPGG